MRMKPIRINTRGTVKLAGPISRTCPRVTYRALRTRASAAQRRGAKSIASANADSSAMPSEFIRMLATTRGASSIGQ
jgi:hypothetical protein